ncbi:MAG: efflux RND transporter periplasmic adaptor subunit [Acidobacteriaceae bacterium]|nr:efflux RND transporter periplasmic adaptor subunit [Acidobacteriaceae bacterium]
MKRKGIVGAAILLAAIVAVAAWYLIRRSSPLVYWGTVETREIQVGSRVSGRVTEVAVEEGQHVKAGAVLVRFEVDEVRAQRAQAQAAVEQAQADVDKFERGYRPEEIAQSEATAREQHSLLEAARIGPRPQELQQAQADYDAAVADAANAEITYKRMQTLVRGETVSRQQYDDALARRDSTAQRAESARQRLLLLQAGTRKEDLEAAEQRYLQARANADLMRRGFRKEDIESARGRLAQAQAQVKELDARLRESELTAPADGVIEIVSIRPGDLVPPGRIVLSMLEPTQLWVRIYIPETELGRVRLGQSATVNVDSLPGRVFEGSVQQINSQAEFLPRNVQTRDDRQHQVFGAKVMVANSDGVLKSGMSARVQLQ